MIKPSKITLFLAIFSAVLLLQACDRKKSPELKDPMSLQNRLTRYSIISNQLACLGDVQLNELLQTATPISIGFGENVTLNVDGVQIFIKKFH